MIDPTKWWAGPTDNMAGPHDRPDNMVASRKGTGVTTTRPDEQLSDTASPLLLVSADGHCGPQLTGQLRAYCEAEHLEAFDDYAASSRGSWYRQMPGYEAPPATWRAIERTVGCAGQNDPHARLKDLDTEGIAAEVIFGGGQNGERMPFMGEGLGSTFGPGAADPKLQAVGLHIYNRWLAEFVSVEAARHVGLAHVPMWDVEASVREVEWARDAGLKGVNFPAPRSGRPAYNDPVYEPFWDACEDLDLPLCCHAGGGDEAMGTQDRGGYGLFWEIHWMGRRGLWQLIFGGIFEHHPRLKVVFTEQATTWVQYTLAELDDVYGSEYAGALRAELPRTPSEYWSSNCYIGASFPSRAEVAMRHEVGLSHFLWGADYPHHEGTWPNTELAIRHAFHDVPLDEARLLLGENALKVFDFDRDALRTIADRIGPTPAEIAEPVDEYPEYRGRAFR
jgi:predicted TIM-barrel fold metal-dependent hydrolase